MEYNYFRLMLKIVSLSLNILLVTLAFSQKKKVEPVKPVQPVEKVYVRKIPFSELQNINDVYYLKDKPFTGTSIELFEDKTRMQEIQWKNGLIDGTKTEYFKGGVLVRAKLNFTAGIRNGRFEYYHQNGQMKLTGKYVNDLLDSTVNAFYENGNPKYTFTYVKGEKTGISLSYFSNGNMEQKVHLVNEKPDGIMETYYEAGNLRLVTGYKMGIRDGKFLRYHLNGTVAEESYFKDGIQDSISMYWDNVFGSIMKIENYNKGKKEGTWVTFNEIGDTLTMYTWQGNVLDGPYKIFASEKIDNQLPGDGTKKKYGSEYVHALDEYGSYKMGQQDGVFKAGLFYRENHVEGQFDNGVKVGEWKYYNDEEKLVLYELYNANGELIKQKPKLQRVKGE